jgi:hypothetical protein
MKKRQKKLVFIDFSYVFEAFFSIITPRRSIASRRFIRNMIDNFEKVENFERYFRGKTGDFFSLQHYS